LPIGGRSAPANKNTASRFFDYVQRINHLQRVILTNQLFRLALQRRYVFRSLKRTIIAD
jgi:hypothetical protein